MRHPEEDELLRFADGELPSRRARQVRGHLESCWECRATFHSLQETVNRCVRYRKEVLGTYLPPPPEPWPDIYRGFADIDTTPGNTSWRDVFAGAFQFPLQHLRMFAGAAVCTALVCAVYIQLRNAPSVHAAQLLRKAIAAADAKPAGSRRIQIRTSTRTITRAGGVLPAAQKSDPLAALFETAHYSWEDPLSARSFANWRDGLAEKHDEITTIDGRYRIRTETGAGELRAAILTLSEADLRPVMGRLEFRNEEWVEIAEIREVPPQRQPETALQRSPAATPEDRAPQSAPAPQATLADELQVIAALHQVGADLGDPVEVSRAGGRVVVSGVGVAPERQRQITSAVDALPRVVVHFTEPSPAVPDEASAPAVTEQAPPRPQAARIQAQMERHAGGRVQFERLSTQLLDASDAMMSRAYALRHLARRFPRDAEPGLAAEDRRLLRNMGREHVDALLRQAAEMDAVVHPPLAALGGAAGTPLTRASADWQAAAEELFRSAQTVERSLAALLAGSGDTLPADLPSQVLAGLAQVRADALHCEQSMNSGAGGR